VFYRRLAEAVRWSGEDTGCLISRVDQSVGGGSIAGSGEMSYDREGSDSGIELSIDPASKGSSQ
jgi:hypothetical protein